MSNLVHLSMVGVATKAEFISINYSIDFLYLHMVEKHSILVFNFVS